ncbi:MAG: acylphosphatase [Deltaproteobacteria bacterium]|nr:acylphosphatase [Deltaproteobacteria bacterium]
MNDSVKKNRVHLKIHGRVQGVYYRASTVQEAQNLGLTGWVMNCPDGSVETVAEGAQQKLEELIAWCRQGPTGARVTSVDVGWEKPENNFCSFSIRR